MGVDLDPTMDYDNFKTFGIRWKNNLEIVQKGEEVPHLGSKAIINYCPAMQS